MPYPKQALPCKYRLENYTIDGVLGIGGFGITYLAKDEQLQIPVAIKEYFPINLAVREITTEQKKDLSHPSHLYPKSQYDEKDYFSGLELFLEEARIVARFNHPNIINIKHFFKANNTAYFVMNYEDGDTLSNLLKSEKRANEKEIQIILKPLLSALQTIHKANYLHRDISPSNIYITVDNKPILIDFGAARQSLGHQSERLSAIVKMGYAPPEQYHTRGHQGPWSDIYAVGAILYQLISCSIPVESIERLSEVNAKRTDPLEPATQIGKGRYSQSLLENIDWALKIKKEARPQSIDEWPILENTVKNRKYRWYGVLSILFLGLIIFLLYFCFFKDSCFKKTISPYSPEQGQPIPDIFKGETYKLNNLI